MVINKRKEELMKQIISSIYVLGIDDMFKLARKAQINETIRRVKFTTTSAETFGKYFGSVYKSNAALPAYIKRSRVRTK